MDKQPKYYKVSYVVEGGEHPGAILSSDHRPYEGEEIIFGGRLFTVVDVMDLMPAVGDFGFLHATCRYIRNLESEELDEEEAP